MLIAFFALQAHFAFSTSYYVSTTGSNTTGNGSLANPWKSIQYALSKVPPGLGHSIQIGTGTFIENGPINVPAGIHLLGAGMDQTIIKAETSFYYHPAYPGYGTDRFLIRLSEYNPTNGNQSLKHFTIDGDSKQLHGGIYVRYRNAVTIENIKVHHTNFSGIWLWDVKDSKIKNVYLYNCSWGSPGFCAGALNLGNLERVEIDQLDVNEDTGYGIKAIGPDGYDNIFQLKIHDSHVSVAPNGQWNNGSAPNIAIELWQVNLVGCEIYNCYVDNTISLVNRNAIPPTGIQSIRVHHNILDMETRAKGAGYGIELTVHDAEIDHNYFLQGLQGIANWDNPMQNWLIHHNVFYALQGQYPGEVVRSQWSGLHQVKFYNNTIEFAGNKTMNVIGLYTGTSDNVDIRNNLVINSNSGYNHYPNELIHSENGASINTLKIRDNSISNLELGSLLESLLDLLPGLPDIDLTIFANPAVGKTGFRPEPYYYPTSGSSLIDAGEDVGLSYMGQGPDVGAFEYGVSPRPNSAPQTVITRPADNDAFSPGPITLIANALDTDGTINKMEFFQGSTKVGEDISYPYSFDWTGAPPGSYTITAKAIDNRGGTGLSPPVRVSVTSSNLPPAVEINSPANNSSFEQGSIITINVDANDTDGSVKKVEFFSATSKLGEDSTFPFSMTWSQIPAGTYSLTARATDNQDVATTSNSITVIVRSTVKVNQPPSVTIASPSYETNLAPGVTLVISAIAADNDGSISKVEFFDGLVKLGEATERPYNFEWIEIYPGEHFLTARATDNTGAMATSDPVRIQVATHGAIIIFPNPAKGSFKIHFVSADEQEAAVSIIDGSSRLIMQLPVTLMKGLNEIEINEGTLSSGLYVIQLQTRSGRFNSRVMLLGHDR